jgi:hypothetical protein
MLSFLFLFFGATVNLIRHFTFISNVENGAVIDPQKVKHGEVTALKISNLSGWVDQQTHLNLDFPKHLMREVYVVENLDIGGRVLLKDERFMTALVSPSVYKHFGFVDETGRAEQLKEAILNKTK